MAEGRSWATIDLAAVRANVATLRQRAAGANVMAVVKADGYGHGAVPVARAALHAGASCLGVAAIGEARELRDAGIAAPILVLGPILLADMPAVAELGVELVVWTPEAAHAARAGGVPIHLKLDTGMGRLGARPDGLADLRAAAHGCHIVGLMTHFATADGTDGADAAFFGEQLLRFRALVNALRGDAPNALVHAANSAACLRDTAAAFDLVRCGIALYGCSPFAASRPDDLGLTPVLTWRTRIGSLKTIRSRESVGYGRTFRAARGTTIALAPVGYADGYLRALGNRAQALVGGRRVPVAGTISMDQLTLDLGPESTARIGDDVVLVGAQGRERILPEELAAHADTISYEIVCRIGPRVERRWTD
ncbi:MAG: alanine racemase [Actinobacteria bacterium]|nr:alanine racemase [Actinomycetota bacterium]